MEYKKIQEVEAISWNMPEATDQERLDKSMREKARYPMMVKQMGLTTCLDTSNMSIIDCGVGAVGGITSVLPYKKITKLDPLTSEYAKFYDVTNYREGYAEDLEKEWAFYDLILFTNSLDHCRDFKKVLQDINTYSKYSCYFSVFSATNNAITHRHEAHEHSINSELIHEIFDEKWETVWELKYPELRYGWVPYMGKCGQPAFTTLYRKTTK